MKKKLKMWKKQKVKKKKIMVYVKKKKRHKMSRWFEPRYHFGESSEIDKKIVFKQTIINGIWFI